MVHYHVYSSLRVRILMLFTKNFKEIATFVCTFPALATQAISQRVNNLLQIKMQVSSAIREPY